MGELVSIVYKPKKLELAEAAYTRVPLRQTRLVADYGIEGDAKGGGRRQLNVMSAHVVQDLAAEGFLAEPGQLGEQLIVDGLDVNALSIGTCLRIGAEACVEFTEPRTGCGKFERYQGKSPRDATGRLGMMARVVTGGLIAVGDPIAVVESEVVVSRR
jgi:MOSC domain-containing protein YiiM